MIAPIVRAIEAMSAQLLRIEKLLERVVKALEKEIEMTRPGAALPKPSPTTGPASSAAGAPRKPGAGSRLPEDYYAAGAVHLVLVGAREIPEESEEIAYIGKFAKGQLWLKPMPVEAKR